MSVIILLVFASLFIAVIFLGAFIWSIRQGQFDDQTGSSLRMLFDEPDDKNMSNH